MKRSLVLVVLLTTSIVLKAQYYDQSAGIRLGNHPAFTYKNFINELQAVEVLLTGREHGIQITGLYQFNRQIDVKVLDNVFMFYGIGAHIGFEKRNEIKRINPFSPNQPEFENRTTSYFSMGIDTNIGVEYRWLSVPITIGFDIKPYFNFVGMRYAKFHFWDTSLSFKYIF